MKNLKNIFEKYGIKLSTDQEKKFDKYFSMLVETNKVMNLTAITEENEVLIKHFLDSALPEKFIKQNATVVDVGSGAGFPAIPLKIVRPDLKIYMVDSLNKRITFLNDVINELQLTNAYAFHDRVEDFAAKNREKFDVSVARAVAPLNTLSEYLLPLVKIGGSAIIYKSTKLDEEIEEAHKAITVLGAKIDSIQRFFIKEEGLERNVLILNKISQTPKKYPRNKNQPKLNPIK